MYRQLLDTAKEELYAGVMTFWNNVFPYPFRSDGPTRSDPVIRRKLTLLS